jgi:hypothetical protein
MNTPSAIARLYNELVRVPATTVVIPQIEDVLRRYSEHPNIYYNERLGFKIFHPAGWMVDPEAGRAGEQFDYLANVSGFISMMPEKNATFRPEIDLVVQNVGDVNFMGYFYLRLNVLNRKGIEVGYHLDELFQVVTLRLTNTNSQGPDFQIQKYFIRDGQVYNVIVRGLDPGLMENEPGLVEEVGEIVRSFAFVSRGGGRRDRLRLSVDNEKALPGGPGLMCREGGGHCIRETFMYT